jgi:hypothetical protein
MPGLAGGQGQLEIENIVTTHDELFKDDVLPESFANPAAKEVLRYRQALRRRVRAGAQQRPADGQSHHHHPERAGAQQAGFRKLPGTALKDGAGAPSTRRRRPGHHRGA